MSGSGDYISREAAIESMYKDAEAHQDHTFWTTQYEALLNIPAADVRPVVLCRDCVYAYPYGLEIKCTKHSGRADRFGEDATYSEFHEESWFCADGQRRRKADV